jgi:hypothetical protein
MSLFDPFAGNFLVLFGCSFLSLFFYFLGGGEICPPSISFPLLPQSFIFLFRQNLNICGELSNNVSNIEAS